MLDTDKAKRSDTAADKAIVFAEREGYRALELDVYRPEGAGEGLLPVVAFVHGGGWRVGHRRAPRETREWERGFFERICDAGFAAVAVSYRFSGEATYPAQIDDVVEALRWIRDHGAEHGLDGDRVYLWGASGGGTLAALAALVPEAPSVRGAVIWYAVSDFLALDLEAGDTWEAHLFGGPVGEHLALARSASPVSHVRADAPPFFIQHGELDTWVAFDQGVRLEKALRSVGAPVELEAVPGADHFFGGAPDIEAIFERALGFLRRLEAGSGA
jgi:acetyl esterase/lipase